MRAVQFVLARSTTILRRPLVIATPETALLDMARWIRTERSGTQEARAQFESGREQFDFGCSNAGVFGDVRDSIHGRIRHQTKLSPIAAAGSRRSGRVG
jgi:hypothetical protein